MARSRKERRAADREAIKDAKRRLKLADLEPGGSPERPIVVATPHLVEPTAKAKPCPVCGGAVRVLEHLAEGALRVAVVRCSVCAIERRVHFALESATLN